MRPQALDDGRLFEIERDLRRTLLDPHLAEYKLERSSNPALFVFLRSGLAALSFCSRQATQRGAVEEPRPHIVEPSFASFSASAMLRSSWPIRPVRSSRVALTMCCLLAIVVSRERRLTHIARVVSVPWGQKDYHASQRLHARLAP